MTVQKCFAASGFQTAGDLPLDDDDNDFGMAQLLQRWPRDNSEEVWSVKKYVTFDADSPTIGGLCSLTYPGDFAGKHVWPGT